MTTTAVAFTLFSRGQTMDEAHKKLTDLVDAMKSACANSNLELTGQHFLPSMNAYCVQWGETDFQGRAKLRIEKRKDVTYNQIYTLINTVQPTHYSIIRD